MSIVNRTSNYGNFTTFEFSSDSSLPVNLDIITISKPTTLDGYTPVNGKMKTFPFCYFYMSNNAGYESEFHWEDFSSTPTFSVEGIVSQGMSIKAYPTNYKRGLCAASDPSVAVAPSRMTGGKGIQARFLAKEIHPPCHYDSRYALPCISSTNQNKFWGVTYLERNEVE